MADVTFIVVIVALFGLASLLVRACERIIGPEEVMALPVEERDEELAA